MPRNNGPMRSSVRSKESSSTSTGPDTRERMKDCCRQLVAFMCTQVGVGGLLVSYAVVGAFGFIMIEGEKPPHSECIQDTIRQTYAIELWSKTANDHKVNILNKTAFYEASNEVLKNYQDNFSQYLKRDNYCGVNFKPFWNFPAALMFCLSVITMIGYGNLVPSTPWGKGATVMYAVIGIPLYVLYFLNIGKVLASVFKWLYIRLYECSNPQKPGHKVTVPSTACLWVMFGYVLAGTIMFAQWEDWDYLDSAYFCVTSLCKIGMGDYMPGWSIGSTQATQAKLIINFVYLLLGMALIAMCYNLMKEDVQVKARELRDDLRQAFEVARNQTVTCCKDDGGSD